MHIPSSVRAVAGPRRRPIRRGFTLLETGVTTIIIGVGVLAIFEAQRSFLASNEWSTHAATATFLANEIREMTRGYPKHDPVTGLFNGVDANNQQILVGWGRESGEITVDDLDDMDDFDNLAFAFDGTDDIADNDVPGPIDAFGDVIADLNDEGATRQDGETTLQLLGWTQLVTVEKVDPFDFDSVRSDNAEDPPQGTFPGRDVDEFPLRVTVQVSYRGMFDTDPREIARVSWIVP